jgi:hypothetical protein
MNDELERFGKKQLWPKFKALSRHSPKGLRKITKKPSQDSRSPGRDLNPSPLEYEAKMLNHSTMTFVYSCENTFLTFGLNNSICNDIYNS